jgi:DNA-directed RNA polymerase subunit F
MILNKEPLSMTETKQFLRKQEEKEAELNAFIEKFVKGNKEKTEDFKKKLESLELIKVKPKEISKIIDMLPMDEEDLNKIFTDVSLDEDETKKILDIIKEFK